MNKISALCLALALGCAGSAFAAPEKDTVKDPNSGVTLHGPRHNDAALPGSTDHKFTAEVKAALHRVASATKRVIRSADNALHSHSNKA